MSKKAVIILADGFEDIEAVAPADVLCRAGIETITAGLNSKSVKGSRGGIRVEADVLLDDITDLPDAVILPGGLPGATGLSKSAKVGEFIKKMNQAGKIIAAICASPALVLTPLGVLDGKKATGYPGTEKNFTSAIRYVNDRVATDGNIITSQGPGTALEFSLEIVRRFAGDKKADELAQALLLKV